MKGWRGYLFCVVYSLLLAAMAFGIGVIGRAFKGGCYAAADTVQCK